MSRADIIRDLKERLRQIERSQCAVKEALAVPSWFLSRPLEWGTLIEWLSAGEGSGAATLALTVAADVLRGDGALVVIDSRREFYPPAAAALGIALERTVIVRPDSSQGALWALEQSLRSGAAAVVLAWLGSLPDAVCRRLQLAAETGSSLGFLLRPSACRTEPSWAQMRLLVGEPRCLTPTRSASEGDSDRLRGSARPTPTGDSDRLRGSARPTPSEGLTPCWQVELLHCRGGAQGEIVQVELSDEADHVHLAARLGHSALPADDA